jgi:glyoxylase-like metal-dependent hydrolase (beta-lactamase superfamily II)
VLSPETTAMKVHFQYHFHPVGQGLFSSGYLHEEGVPQPRLVWVFDCGSLPSNPPINWPVRIADLRRLVCGKPSIDLLALSHFDADHISGVTALLAHFRVEALILPYVPLWERLLIPFSKGIGPDDDRMRYYVDPVSYLREIGGNNLGRIILIEPSGGDGPVVDPQGGDTPRFPEPGDKAWTIKVKTRPHGCPVMSS